MTNDEILLGLPQLKTEKDYLTQCEEECASATRQYHKQLEMVRTLERVTEVYEGVALTCADYDVAPTVTAHGVRFQVWGAGDDVRRYGAVYRDPSEGGRWQCVLADTRAGAIPGAEHTRLLSGGTREEYVLAAKRWVALGEVP